MSTRTLARLRRLVTLPATRSLIIAAVRSPTIRTVAQRVAHDRAGLVRDLRRPVKVRDMLLRGARHPAAGELASAGLLFLPGRYIPLGSAATWAARRILHRYLGPTDQVAAERPLEGGPGRSSSDRVVVGPHEGQSAWVVDVADADYGHGRLQ